jgi:hypothetical protein
LRKVTKKEDLLAVYLEQCEIIHSDFATFSDYQKMFEKIGVTIKVNNEPVKLLGGSEQWKTRMYLKYQKKRIKSVPKAEGYNPEGAFSNLRHKLLCGEIIDVAGVSWQVVPDGNGMPELKQLEK